MSNSSGWRRSTNPVPASPCRWPALTNRLKFSPGKRAASLSLVVPDAQAWWPRGYGEQPLYDVAVDLAVEDQRLDGWHGRVGFRTVTLSTKPDASAASS